jgi:hypothetical protein
MDRKHTMQRDGKTYVLYGGLLDLLHEQSAGRFSISTALVQIPHPDNGNTAIVTAEVRIVDEHGQTVRACTGIGDANPGNCNRMMAAHLIRFCETRAKARAMRDIVNVGDALNDDPTDDDDDAPAGAPPPTQLAAVRTALAATARPAGDPAPAPAAQPPAGNKMTRSQLWAAYRALVGQCFALHSAGTATLPEHLAKLCHFPPDVPDDDLKAGYKHLLAWHKAAKEGQG